jgi:tRNA-dihydrouridine synthase A
VSENNPNLHFIVHARKAWLNGLSTKQNRTVPPLHYDYVYSISKERPDLKFTINGGITSLASVKAHASQFDGDIMIGRGIYENPLFLYQLVKGNLKLFTELSFKFAF